MTELKVSFDLKLTAKQFVGAAALCVILASCQKLGCETLTLTTYYPAPYGAYKKIVTTDATVLARDTGNVGIGTDSPTVKLDVRGAASITGAVNLTNGAIVTNASSNVGIKTANPTKTLEVTGDIKTGTLILNGAVPASPEVGQMWIQ